MELIDFQDELVDIDWFELEYSDFIDWIEESPKCSRKYADLDNGWELWFFGEHYHGKPLIAHAYLINRELELFFDSYFPYGASVADFGEDIKNSSADFLQKNYPNYDFWNIPLEMWQQFYSDDDYQESYRGLSIYLSMDVEAYPIISVMDKDKKVFDWRLKSFCDDKFLLWQAKKFIDRLLEERDQLNLFGIPEAKFNGESLKNLDESLQLAVLLFGKSVVLHRLNLIN